MERTNARTEAAAVAAWDNVSSTGSYPTLLLCILALSNVPDAVAAFGADILVPAKTSTRSATRSTKKEKPRLRPCSTRPSSRKAPRWCRRSPYFA